MTNIIKQYGAPQTATVGGNKQVTRQEQIFIIEWGAFVKCAPYDDHFVYENPDKMRGASAYMCTCGAPAVVAPPGPGGLFVCLFHATYGGHQTSVINRKDFEQNAGETVRAKKVRRWV